MTRPGGSPDEQACPNARTAVIGIVCSAVDEPLLREMLGDFESITQPAAGYYLSFQDDVLELRRVGESQGISVLPAEVDRRLAGPFLLGRACGLSGRGGLRLLDATGGLGVDALALARKGASVDVVEREPVLFALLKDLIRRSGAADVHPMLADSTDLLAGSVDYDVIYLDPMFPARRKKALPGKRMQYLGELLVNAAPFDVTLLTLAQQRARSRVVLKRRLKDPVELSPDWTLKGRSVRYDVYRGLLSGTAQPSRRMA